MPLSGKNAQLKEEVDDIISLLTPHGFVPNKPFLAKRELVLCAWKTLQSLQKPNQVNMVNFVGEIAPDEISPIVKLIIFC